MTQGRDVFDFVVRVELKPILDMCALAYEAWDTGTTIHAVAERVRQAGGIPTTAVLHYKPTHSKVPSMPDHHVVTTDRWVVYPFKSGR